MSDIETKDVIKRAGGAQKVAESLGIHRQSVYGWIRSGRIPAERCPDIERLSGGLVLCEQMRPDVNWRHLRTGQAGAA